MSQPNLISVDFNPFEEEKNIVKIVPSNEPQKEIWLSCLIGGDDANLGYNESISLDFKGNLNVEEFRNSFDEVLNRHEALRSSLSGNGEFLFIYERVPLNLTCSDISANADQEALLKDFISNEMQSPFNLQEGPLVRTFLHKLSDQHHYFSLVVHHIICDGWSLGVILSDLSQIYNAKINHISPCLSPAPQISEYAKEMHDFMQGADYRNVTDYWLRMYHDTVPVLNLPTDRERPTTRSYKATRIDKVLSLNLVNQLKKTGAKQGCTLVNTLLSAFEVFLYLESNQRDIVVGLPSAGQAATENFGLVGHCVNLLPLRSTIDTNWSFSEYLRRRKRDFFDAQDNQKITFGELLKKLNTKRDSARIPLVPVVFNIDMGMDNDVEFDHLTYKLISNPRACETFEIFLNATGSKSSFILEWSYNTQLFESSTIHQLATNFERLLEKLAGNADILISDLSKGASTKWVNQTNLWNNTDREYLQSFPFTNLIDRIALKYPSKTALKFGDQILSYKDLVIRSEQFAGYLLKKGIKHGEIVALAVDRSIEMVVALLGIIKAGAVYLPLDPEYPQERIDFMLEDSNAKMLLVSKTYSNKFVSTAIELSIADIWPVLASFKPNLPSIAIKKTDIVYILYTSGSTGKPKGVRITQGNLMNFLLSMQSCPGITAEDKLLAITTIGFDIAGLELYLPLITGAELIVCDREAARDGRILRDLIEKENITIMQATPSTWRMVLESGLSRNNRLKILCGGESLNKDLAGKLVEKCAELWNMYGPTETTIWSTVKQIRKNEDITIGRPIHNTQVYIVAENNTLAAPGAVGEICIGGDGVAAGYLNREDLTAERFVSNPFSAKPGCKLYKTGDLGSFINDGEIICLGRIDQQVKIRGHRIELGEIENELILQQGIKHAIVVANEDALGNKTLIGYVLLEDETITNLTPSWKDRWDNIYDIAAVSAKDQILSDQKMDVNLLENMQNGEQLAREAEEWLAVSVKRLKQLDAKYIFEIGSGAGQLLFELAEDAKSYYATDYAETAIDKLQQKLNSDPEKWAHVKAKAIPAHDFTGISPASFDLVLIHSVAQYFPNTDYFLTVIRESVIRIKDGGCLFIGDMQGMNTLSMHHAMDHLSHSKPESLVSDFKEVVDNRVKIEDEFIADPNFFYLLPKLIPAITGVDVQLREGKSINETTKYHFDVWIYVNSSHQYLKADTTLEWASIDKVEAVSTRLGSFRSEILEVKNIFNARTAKDYTLFKWLESVGNDHQMKEFDPLLKNIEPGMHPDLFFQIGREQGFQTHIRWSTDGTDGNFDVVFIPDKNQLVLPDAPYLAETNIIEKFARTPLSANEIFLPKQRIEQWKAALKQTLPDYMIPSEIIGLKQFPHTPNHKIDKNSLPKPHQKHLQPHAQEDLPHSKNEQIISDIWTAVLGLENISIKDDFFELGGHSLLAVKVMASIEKETGKRLPLATLFENSTIENLAKQIDVEEKQIWNALVPIKSGGSKDPLYLIHGGGLNILFYKPIIDFMDEEQPIYGLQALGLYHDQEIPQSIEEISALYIDDLLKANPNGPYCLAGYSFGGIIAFEMSRQLEKMGKKVKFTAIVDTYIGGRTDTSTGIPRILKKIVRQFEKIPFLVRSLYQYPSDTVNYQLVLAKYRLKHLFTGVNSAESEPTEAYIKDFNSYERKIYDAYEAALEKYQLTPADIKISLLRVTKRIYYIDDSTYLGWKRYAKKDVQVYLVPGDHRSILHPPNDRGFARILQKAIDDAE